ncbi:MAG TPA: hypothetical protein VM120_04470 [Bryobacteraceae bacterium]|nr:hypothetical protein [Bryobacteraceae bacterium]
MIPFREHCATVQQHVEGRYGIRVVIRDVPDPLTGDLDGCEIHIDHAVTAEERLFLLAHLFGHTVQWNASPRALEIGQVHQPPVAESLLPDIMEYEREAAGYALSMLRETGITQLDQWLSDYTACDMAYLKHYYRTGEKLAFSSFWRDATEPLQPVPIPSFVPAARTFRRDGIVI